MRLAICGFVLVALTAVGTRAQDATQFTRQVHQTPDQDGAYYSGPEVTAPRLVRTFLVPYPYGVAAREVQGMTVLATMIDAKGSPQHIEVLRTHGKSFDVGAIAAVQRSTFEPGKLGNKPVPVWIDVRVVFHANRSHAIPQVLIAERDLPPPNSSHFVDKHHRPLSYTPPIPIHTVDADFDDPFTNRPFVQVALVTVLVNEQGLPAEVRVKRGLGFGLDQKAEAAVQHYRFLPATSKGKPIAASRDVMVSFSEF